MGTLTTAQRRRDKAAEPSGDRGQAIEAARPGGQPLDDAARSYLEPRFGHNFADVRIHSDAAADRLANDFDAVAFTTGRDIFFQQGAYAPASPGGLHLLAHELTHTIQQAAGPVAGTPGPDGVAVSDPSDAFERAAEQNAERIMSGTQAPPTAAAPSSDASAHTADVQRCGATPCDCSPEEQEAHAIGLSAPSRPPSGLIGAPSTLLPSQRTLDDMAVSRMTAGSWKSIQRDQSADDGPANSPGPAPDMGQDQSAALTPAQAAYVLGYQDGLNNAPYDETRAGDLMYFKDYHNGYTASIGATNTGQQPPAEDSNLSNMPSIGPETPEQEQSLEQQKQLEKTREGCESMPPEAAEACLKAHGMAPAGIGDKPEGDESKGDSANGPVPEAVEVAP